MHPTQLGRAHKLHQSRIATYSLHHLTSKTIIYATIEHSLIFLSHVTQRLHAQHITSPHLTSPTQTPTSHKCQSPPSTSPPHRRRPANTYGAPSLTQNEAARHGATSTDTKGVHHYARVVPVSVFFSNRHHDPLNLHGCDRTIFSQGAKSILAWFAIGRVGVGGGVYRSGDG
jgi:hypothetical protein